MWAMYWDAFPCVFWFTSSCRRTHAKSTIQKTQEAIKQHFQTGTTERSHTSWNKEREVKVVLHQQHNSSLSKKRLEKEFAVTGDTALRLPALLRQLSLQQPPLNETIPGSFCWNARSLQWFQPQHRLLAARHHNQAEHHEYTFLSQTPVDEGRRCFGTNDCI